MKSWHAFASCLIAVFAIGDPANAIAEDSDAEDSGAQSYLVDGAHDQKISPEQLSFFESKIRPVLIRECYSCHSNQTGNARGGLRLDTRQLTAIGGDGGPAVVPGDLDASLLWAAITYDGYEMPPNRQLSPSIIEDFRQWIEMGAPDPRQTKIGEIKSTITDEDIKQAKQSFWAYQQPQPHDAPDVSHTQWPRGEIDKFVLARLESNGLDPTPDADGLSFLRRLTFDLVGLPPTLTQQNRFEKQWKADPDRAIELWTDHLLGSDQFGERWGRHWLDVVRYAESTGRGVNMTYPHAWRYRDFVIDSFNKDKPYDQFVQQQIAGDLMPADSDQQWTENLVATSFLALGAKNLNEQNPVQFAADLADEQIDATTRVFLGQSVACARCHDHKFDPIPQTDYYALAGVFSGMKTYFGNPPSEFGAIRTAQLKRTSSLILLPTNDANPFDKRYSDSELEDLKQQIRDKQSEMASLGGRGGSGNSLMQRLRLTNEISGLSAKLAVVDADGQPRSYCMGVQDPQSPQNVRVLVRGEIDAPGQVVQRGFPQVLCSTTTDIPSDETGRLQLARWMGSRDNPVAARVMVNRVWQKLFGQGIVGSLENFGATGDQPSHPQLLDRLAVDFMDQDWSVKSLVRQIVNSRAYRMGTDFDQSAFELDPNNRLLWRNSPRRLDSEAIRDTMLMVAGQLNLDRPRGSEVAKAGYVRVRDGVLGDGREVVRQRVSAMVSERAQGDRRDTLRNRFGSRSGARGRFGSSGRSRDSMGRNTTGRDTTMGRRTSSVRPSQEDFANAINKATNMLDMEEATYRSVYLPIVRDELPRSMEVFDFADPSAIIGARETSNTANQALYLMNNDFVIDQCDRLARGLTIKQESVSDQIETAFRLIYGRPPESDERRYVASFYRSFSSSLSSDFRASDFRVSGNRDAATQTLSAICQSLFASAEFRYLD